MNDQLDRYIDSVEHLPTPPVIMVKLITAFRKSDPDVDEIANLLARDPSLTAEVLRRCNSAYFGGEETISGVFDAIMRMGFYEVYQTAVAISGQKAMSTSKPIGNLHSNELWRHSVATAVLSGMLAKEVGESESVAYTAGLLHDIGKLVLASAEGTKYGALMRETGSSGCALENAEKAALGFGHGAIGARLLERWSVPAEIAAPIRCHHDLDWADPAAMPAIINLGNILAHHLNAETGQVSSEFPDAAKALDVLQIQDDQLASLTQRAKDEIKEMESLLHLAPLK